MKKINGKVRSLNICRKINHLFIPLCILLCSCSPSYKALKSKIHEGNSSYVLDNSNNNSNNYAILLAPRDEPSFKYELISIDDKEIPADANEVFIPLGSHVIKLKEDYDFKEVDERSKKNISTRITPYGIETTTSYLYTKHSGTQIKTIPFNFEKSKVYKFDYSHIEPRSRDNWNDVIQISFWGGLSLGLIILIL